MATSLLELECAEYIGVMTRGGVYCGDPLYLQEYKVLCAYNAMGNGDVR